MILLLLHHHHHNHTPVRKGQQARIKRWEKEACRGWNWKCQWMNDGNNLMKWLEKTSEKEWGKVSEHQVAIYNMNGTFKWFLFFKHIVLIAIITVHFIMIPLQWKSYEYLYLCHSARCRVNHINSKAFSVHKSMELNWRLITVNGEEHYSKLLKISNKHFSVFVSLLCSFKGTLI